jgi:hypothetical protein
VLGDETALLTFMSTLPETKGRKNALEKVLEDSVIKEMLINHLIEAHSLDEITKVILKVEDAKQEMVDKTLEDEES